MIESLNYSLFPSDEFFTFAKGALTVIEPQKEAVAGIEPFFVKAKAQLSDYQNALERETKSPYTILLSEKDAIRDSAFIAFRTYVEAAGYRTLVGWNDAANKILEIIRKHGWSAASLGYKAETAILTNIISEIKTKCTAELTLLGATDWLNELESAETAFETTVHQSVTAVPKNELTIWEVRPKLAASLKSLFSMISLLNSAMPSENLTSLETALNELIVRSLATVRAADTRKENAKEDGEKQES